MLLDPSAADLDEAGGLVVRDEGGGLAGNVRWTWHQWGPEAQSRCVQVALWLRPEHRGRALETLVLRELADLFFERTAVHRVEAYAGLGDDDAQRAMTAAGFVAEGVVRGAWWRDGAHLDGVLHATLRTDPR